MHGLNAGETKDEDAGETKFTLDMISFTSSASISPCELISIARICGQLSSTVGLPNSSKYAKSRRLRSTAVEWNTAFNCQLDMALDLCLESLTSSPASSSSEQLSSATGLLPSEGRQHHAG